MVVLRQQLVPVPYDGLEELDATLGVTGLDPGRLELLLGLDGAAPEQVLDGMELGLGSRTHRSAHRGAETDVRSATGCRVTDIHCVSSFSSHHVG